jgi:molybdopterin-binding protein
MSAPRCGFHGSGPERKSRKPAHCSTAKRELATISHMRISARNHLIGKIVELQLGDIMAHVTVEVGNHVVESVITRRSAEEMELKVGDTVAAVIKSTEVMLQKA